MFDDRARQAPPPLALIRRLRAWMGWPAEPPLPRPHTQRIPRLRRSWLSAAWRARTAVVARLPLDDYLRARLARYLAALPVIRNRLPLAVEVRNGDLAVVPVDPELRAPPEGEPWLAALIALEGPGVRHELAALEQRLVALEGQAATARERAEALRRRLAGDVAAGVVAGPPVVVATPEQLGRPPVRSAGAQLGLTAFAAASVLAETWQLALPMLRSAGLDPTRLRAELTARPAEVLLTAGYALGVAVGLFTLAQGALEAAARFLREEADPRQRRWLATGAALASLTAAAVAAAGANLPAGETSTRGFSPVSLLLAVPLGTALLLRRARREREAREVELAAALLWDRERARQLADRARRQDEVTFAVEEEADVARAIEAARQRQRTLAQRALAATHLVEGAERRERLALVRLGQGLVGALELDRHEFVRQATARGDVELLAGRRKPAEPPRPVPAVLEPATEGGRMAG